MSDRKWVIDKDSVIPLYFQVKEYLKNQIQSGVYTESEMIPSERELSEEFGINRLTVRQAINELVQEGFLYRQRGVGTFVSKPKIEQPLARLTNFSTDMMNRGITPGAQVVSMKVVPAGKYVASQLKIDQGTNVIELVRVRTADGEPMALEKSCLVYDLTKELLGMEMENVSLYKTLETVCGIKLVRAIQSIEIASIRPEEAPLLDIDPRDPVMQIERTTFTQDSDKPVEYVCSYYRADRYKFIIEMNV